MIFSSKTCNSQKVSTLLGESYVRFIRQKMRKVIQQKLKFKKKVESYVDWMMNEIIEPYEDSQELFTMIVQALIVSEISLKVVSFLKF